MTCAIDGCGALLAAWNRSGYCNAHRRFSEAHAASCEMSRAKPEHRERARAVARAYEAARRHKCGQRGCAARITRRAKRCRKHAAKQRVAR